ncbi:MAG: SIMPL domain-containing protein [Pseudorhodoplanes sp.]|nr:SIMPL domain-containing protein [Pseudorhodoplanes sp.]
MSTHRTSTAFVFAFPAIVSAFLAAVTPAFGQAEPRPPAVTVTGEATLSQAPDLAVLQAGVTRQAKTAREAMASSGEAMKAIFAALRQLGIADADIQTSRLRLEPVREHRDGRPAVIIAVEATSLVTVQVRAIDKAADILDRMVTAGANLVTGINFTIDAPSKLLDQARADAMADARRKAEIYARSAGMKLGHALSIAEGHVARPLVRTLAAREASMPVAAGEEKLTLTVTVSFALLP